MPTQTKTRWNQLATWWDDAYQEGDLFHRTFLFPTILQWTAANKDMRILDIGCGNGALARLLAQMGANVVAIDFSDVFINKAKQRSNGFNIDYRVIDATDESQLNTLISAEKFDRVISSMVLNNLPIIAPLFSVLPKLLAPNGKFIFSLPHPCFNSGLVAIEALKQHMLDGHLILANRYINFEAFEILSKPGQPVKQLNFHRSLSELFTELCNANLMMSGFVEPVANKENLPADFLWAKLSEIPPAIISQWEIRN